MERTSFWTRVGHWFRNTVRPEADDDPASGNQAVSMTDDHTIRKSASSPAKSAVPPESAVIRRKGGLASSSTRDTMVIDLVESIRNHLEEQGQWMKRVADALDRSAANLTLLPEQSRKQLDKLTAIHEQLEAESKSTRRVEEMLSHLPRMADAQRESMVCVTRQLDVLRESSDRGTNTLAGFQESVSKLGEATGATTDSLKKMHADTTGREERLAAQIEKQTRRLSLIGWSAVGVAGIAVALAMVSLFR